MGDKAVEGAEVTSPNDMEATHKEVDPPPALRENLVSTAVKFLQNPRVQETPLAKRKEFLEKKGLSLEEIELAIQRSGATEAVRTAPPIGQQHQNIPAGGGMIVAQPETVSSWSRLRDYVASLIVAGGVSYAIYHFARRYLWRYFPASQSDKKLDSIDVSVKQLETSVAQTLTQIQETLGSIQTLLTEQQDKVQKISRETSNLQRPCLSLRGFPGDSLEVRDVTKGAASSSSSAAGVSQLYKSAEAINLSQEWAGRDYVEEGDSEVDVGCEDPTGFGRSDDPSFVTDIKAEITSLKGLLLSRRQFPPAPVTTPVVPAWQLAGKPSSTENEDGDSSKPVAISEGTEKLAVDTSSDQSVGESARGVGADMSNSVVMAEDSHAVSEDADAAKNENGEEEALAGQAQETEQHSEKTDYQEVPESESKKGKIKFQVAKDHTLAVNIDPTAVSSQAATVE